MSVYANDVYRVLSPTVPILLAADASGVLTIIQETHTIAAVCLKVTPQPVKNPTAAGDSSLMPLTVPINPMAKITAKLAKIQSGGDLDKARIPNADGTESPLLPVGITGDQKTATAQATTQFVKMNNTLPQDGTVQPGAGTRPGLTQAVEFVFNKIKVFFEDLVRWLGFLFQWSDILRTHKVLKNILKTYAIRATTDIVLRKSKSPFGNVLRRVRGAVRGRPAWVSEHRSAATIRVVSSGAQESRVGWPP